VKVSGAQVMINEYVHQELNQEIVAIGGYYELVKEARMLFSGRSVLVLLGHAAFETSCCGVGGCAYALVPGFIVNWKRDTNAKGESVSQVERICDETVQKEVRQLIEASEIVHQVVFL
jgi:hypothetical protein